MADKNFDVEYWSTLPHTHRQDSKKIELMALKCNICASYPKVWNQHSDKGTSLTAGQLLFQGFITWLAFLITEIGLMQNCMNDFMISQNSPLTKSINYPKMFKCTSTTYHLYISFRVIILHKIWYIGCKVQVYWYSNQ